MTVLNQFVQNRRVFNNSQSDKQGTATLTQKNPYASFWFNKDKDGILPDVKSVLHLFNQIGKSS
jgi:hypothetical protein